MTHPRLRAALRPDLHRHRGFLNAHRGWLAVGAIAACGVLASIPALPASAEVVVEEVSVSNLQSFAAPASLSMPVVTRDGFGVTTYTLVQWPVPSSTTMSSDFGYRSCAGCSSNHLGIDLNPGNGYPVQSIADGIVVLAEESSAGLGVQVVVEHVVNGVTMRSLYAHLQFGSLAVGVGDRVARGQQVGIVGSTGASTGPHLHFGILVDGTEVDPHSWLLANVNS